MSTTANILHGTVHGKTIALDRDAGLPDGQKVTVMLQPTGLPGEGLKRAFGAWADDSVGIDQFLEEVRRDRKATRPEQDR